MARRGFRRDESHPAKTRSRTSKGWSWMGVVDPVINREPALVLQVDRESAAQLLYLSRPTYLRAFKMNDKPFFPSSGT